MWHIAEGAAGGVVIGLLHVRSAAATTGTEVRPEVILVLNWFDKLQRLVPTP